jgi:ThiF family
MNTSIFAQQHAHVRHNPYSAFADEPLTDLSGCSILLAGCGSMGSWAAESLGSCGVGRVVLADRDRLSADNVRRHACRLDDVGLPKTAALGRHLRDRFPRLDVAERPMCFLDNGRLLRREIEAADAVLVAVDDERPKYVIDLMAWQFRRPVVYCGVYGGGWGGEVVLVEPVAGTPCYGCAARALGRFGVPVDPPEPTAAYALPLKRPDSNGWATADLTSIMPTAALAAAVVVAGLKARAGNSRPLDELCVDGASAWRFAFRRVAAWGVGPWSLQPMHVQGDPACPQDCDRPECRFPAVHAASGRAAEDGRQPESVKRPAA